MVRPRRSRWLLASVVGHLTVLAVLVALPTPPRADATAPALEVTEVDLAPTPSIPPSPPVASPPPPAEVAAPTAPVARSGAMKPAIRVSPRLGTRTTPGRHASATRRRTFQR